MSTAAQQAAIMAQLAARGGSTTIRELIGDDPYAGQALHELLAAGKVSSDSRIVRLEKE